MRTHYVRSWPEFFCAILDDRRVHELRRNDRDFQVGDLVVLKEWDPIVGIYTGRSCPVRVTAMTSAEQPCAESDQGLRPGFCILSISRVQ